MNNKVRNMIKSVVEENAIGFKAATSNALYEKIGNKLKDQYKVIAKDLFKKKITEEATLGSETGESASSEAAFVLKPPSPPPPSRQPPSRGVGSPPPDPGPPPTRREKESDEEFKKRMEEWRKRKRARDDWFRRNRGGLEEATSIAMGTTEATVGTEGAIQDGGGLGLPPMAPGSGSGEAPPIPRGPNGEQGMTLEEFVKQYYRKKTDFGSREEWMQWLEEYYKQYIDMMQQWDAEQRWRERNIPRQERRSPTRYPSWKQFRQREEQQPTPNKWLNNT
jgi:hypothetical protein